MVFSVTFSRIKRLFSPFACKKTIISSSLASYTAILNSYKLLNISFSLYSFSAYTVVNSASSSFNSFAFSFTGLLYTKTLNEHLSHLTKSNLTSIKI